MADAGGAGLSHDRGEVTSLLWCPPPPLPSSIRGTLHLYPPGPLYSSAWPFSCSSPKQMSPNKSRRSPQSLSSTERATWKTRSRCHQKVLFCKRRRSLPFVDSPAPPEGEKGTVRGSGNLGHFLVFIVLQWRCIVLSKCTALSSAVFNAVDFSKRLLSTCSIPSPGLVAVQDEMRGAARGGLCLRGPGGQMRTVALAFGLGEGAINSAWGIADFRKVETSIRAARQGREGIFGETPGQTKARGASPRTYVVERERV